MARTTHLGINIFSHWSGRGLKQARRNLNQFGDGLQGTNKAARRLQRTLARVNRTAARGMTRGQVRELRRLAKEFRSTDADGNRFRRGLFRLRSAFVRTKRGIGTFRRGLHDLGSQMIASEKRGRALTRVFKLFGKRLLLFLAPALIEIIGHLAMLAVQITTIGAVAAIGFGGFGAAMLAASQHARELQLEERKLRGEIDSEINSLQERKKAIQENVGKDGKLTKAQKEQIAQIDRKIGKLKEERKQVDLMSDAQRKHVNAIDGLKKAWHRFLGSKTGGKLLKPMTIAIKAITRNMHKLKPLVNAIAPVFTKIARKFADWMDRSNGFKRFVKVMKKDGVPIMKNLASAARSVLKFLGRAFRDSLPGARKLSKRIKEGAKALAKWSADGGFKRWLRRMERNGPKVRRLLRQMGKFARKLWDALEGLAPIARRFATILLRIANNLSPGQLRALLIIWILWRPALLAVKAAIWGVNFALGVYTGRAVAATAATYGAAGASGAARGKGAKFRKVLTSINKALRGLIFWMFAGGAIKGLRKLGGKFKFLKNAVRSVVYWMFGGGLLRGLRKLGGRLRGGGGGGGLIVGIGKLGDKFKKLKTKMGGVVGKLGGGGKWGLIKGFGKLAAGSVVLTIVTFGLFEAWDLIDEKMHEWDKMIKEAIIDQIGNLITEINDLTNASKGLADAWDWMGDQAEGLSNTVNDWIFGDDEPAHDVQRLGASALGAGNQIQSLRQQADRAGGTVGRLGGAAAGAGGHAASLRDQIRMLGGASERSGGQLRGAGGAIRGAGGAAGGAAGNMGRLRVSQGWVEKQAKELGISVGDLKAQLKAAGVQITDSDRVTSNFGGTVDRTSRDVRNRAGGRFRGASQELRNNWGGAVRFVRDKTRKNFTMTVARIGWFRDEIESKFKKIKKTIYKQWGNATDSVRDRARKRFNAAGQQAKQLKGVIRNQFERIKRAIYRKWGNATDSVRDRARKRFNAAGQQAKQLKRVLRKQFDKIKKDILKTWGSATDSVRDRARKRFNAAGQQAKQLKRVIRKQFDAIKKDILKTWGSTTDSVRDRARKRFNAAGQQSKQLKRVLRKQFDKIKKDIKQTWGSATEFVKDKARSRFNDVERITKRFRKDIQKQFDKLKNHVKRTWDDITGNIKETTKKRLKETLKNCESILKKIRKAFENAKDAIKKTWNKLPEIFKKPVRFFVEVVYNKGLRKAWNGTFARLPGIKEMDKANVPFANGGLAQRGGRVRGPGGPTADKIPAALSSGEFVVRAKAVKALGVDVLNRINNANSVGGDLPKRGTPVSKGYARQQIAQSHFAGGGQILGGSQRHNKCSYYRPTFNFAEGGYVPWPNIDIVGIGRQAIGAGIKQAKKSEFLTGMGRGMAGFFGGGGDPGSKNKISGGIAGAADNFDWATMLYQDVARKVGKKVLQPFVDTQYRVANGAMKKTGDWGEVPGAKMRTIMDELLAMIVAAANVGCGSNGFAPFRSWRAGDGARVRFRGVTLNKRTRDMCRASEKKAKRRFQYFQGSWSNAAASAGTHSGGGAVDLGPTSNKHVAAMRASGFAAWNRGPGWGSPSFMKHIHGIAVGDKQLSGAARAQVRAFMNGKDGLAGNSPDNFVGGGACNIGGSGVKRWAPLAMMALRLGGCPATPGNLREFLDLMRQESGGDPGAQNNWDSNARAGNASRGLMQVIPTTFRSNHVRGTSWNIFDPLANMAASVRYIKRRYGCRIPNAPYAMGGLVQALCSGGAVGMYRPTTFDTGGTLRPGWNQVFNGTGGPERVERVRNGNGQAGGEIHVHFHGPVVADKRKMRDLVIDAVHDGQRRGRIR